MTTPSSFDWSHVTPFQRRVYEALLQVPAGKVTTYGLLAKAIGCGSAQAVGQALRRNPFAPDVPCHRVVASDLTLGGFGGETAGENMRRKERLLASEGVRITNGKLADPTQLHYLTKGVVRSSNAPTQKR
jgi:methylated-DNA-[protein]-cysteine S-methyltransferase